MKVIGITGIFGAGKTTVSKFFSQLGAEIIDADKISHKIIEKEVESKLKIIACFGKEILDNRGRIIRRKLAEKVFKDKKKLSVLSNILHPIIIRNIKSQLKILKQNKPEAIIVIDAPLLIETGLHNIVDKIIVVKSDYEIIVKRCKAYKNLTNSEIISRIRSQIGEKEKLKYANYVIDNNGSLSKTKKQVERIWQKLHKTGNT